MSYFTRVEDYKTYENSPTGDLHYSYNANSGGGQAFLGGKYRDDSGELQSLPPLNNKIAVFGLDLEDTNGNTLFINLGTSDKEKTNTLKALLDDGLDTLQELLEAIPQDSRQLSCEELVPRLRKALGQAKTCGKLEQQIRDLEES